MHARVLFVSVALAFFVLSAVAQPCKRGFSAPDRIVTAAGAESAAYGDFDEDGRIDVAFTSGYRLAVSVNRGGGVFEPVSSEWLPPEYSTTPLQGVTDLDRDGHLDLLFGTFLDAWARGRGDGTFVEPLALRLYDGFLSGSRLIDFDHDGFLDVALWTDDEVHFFRAAESGAFAAAASARFADSPEYLQGERVTAGDFDGDGNLDAVRVAFDLRVGKWVASFLWSATTPAPVPAAMVLPFASVGTFEPIDLDGDGSEELLGTSADALIVLHLANRTLTHESLPFPDKPTYTPRHPMVADVDGDGRDDLLFSYGSSAAIARGIDAGRFAEAVLLGAGGADDFTRADIDGNGVADIVTTRGEEGLYVVYAGGAIAESPAQRLFPLTFDPRGLQLADVNGDGLEDVIANGGDSNRVSVLLNDGAGFFRLAATQDGLGPRVVVADFDGDAHPDLTAGPVEQVPVPPVVAFGDGTGRFPATVELPLARVIGSLRTSAAATAGAEVLVIQNGEVRALRVTRAGEVTATTLFPHPQNAVVQPFDRNGDGIDEIAMATPSGIEILEHTGSTWTAVHRLAAPRSAPQRIVATDLDGDHVDDLFVTFADDAAFYLRNGSGYGPARVVESWGFFDDAAVADVDGDRHPDLIIASRQNFGEPGTLQVLRNDGLGAFTPYNTSLTGPPHGRNAIVTDVDGDGAPDVLLPVLDGVEMQRNVCVTARVRVAAVPRRVTPGHPVKLVVHASSTDSFAIGGITIRWNGAVVAQDQPHLADDYATTVWTSAPLPEGRHVFTIEYLDPFAGPSSTTLTLDVTDAPPRRRTVRH